MWLACPRVLDEPVRILGLEPEDFTTSLGLPTMLSLVMDALPALCTGVAFGVAMYLSKRGRPQGDLLHQLHALEVLPLQVGGVLGCRDALYSPWP